MGVGSSREAIGRVTWEIQTLNPGAAWPCGGGWWAKTLLPTGEAQAHLRVFAVEELVLLRQGCGPRPSPCSCGLQHSLPRNGDTFPSK